MGKAKLKLIILGIFMVAFFLMSTFVQDAIAETGDIDYSALTHDGVPGKPGLVHPSADANKYGRGCEEGEECRATASDSAST